MKANIHFAVFGCVGTGAVLLAMQLKISQNGFLDTFQVSAVAPAEIESGKRPDVRWSPLCRGKFQIKVGVEYEIITPLKSQREWAEVASLNSTNLLTLPQFPNPILRG